MVAHDLSVAAGAVIDALVEVVIGAMSSSPGLQIAIIEAGGGGGRSIAGGLLAFFDALDREPAGARLALGKLGHSAAASAMPLEVWIDLAALLSTTITGELARALASEPERLTKALRLERELGAWALSCVVQGYPTDPRREHREAPPREGRSSFQAVRRLIHDLRSPIHALLGITEVLSGGEVEAHSQDGRELLADLHTSARKLAGIVEGAAHEISVLDAREREQP